MVNSFLSNEGGWIIAGVACLFVFFIVLFSKRCREGPPRDVHISNSNNISIPKRSYQKFLVDLDKMAPEVIYKQEEKCIHMERIAGSETMSKERQESIDLTFNTFHSSHSYHIVTFDSKIDTLPYHSYPSNDTALMNIINKQPDCSICLETFCIGERLRVLPCMHCFHSCCSILWLMRCSLCPLCKSDVWKSVNTTSL
ncbi:hypothetical protein Gasu2_16830 [Galdieria sulphuraria]|uniref:Zinc finger (C3HC4-type RING finger) family protein n=1 Tax=Galdieria sulphuraria TaxID=130081 RepID=M2XX17_GALSU|nr:zinc finger (C3HC4-type RING finger) family protein [Galdieria sulphuraria]EME28173.1 zinc finger (C3HC4-type RING finger) family protein [Galdieria sulphuraria]GJD07317.1 hypothetical protein Gasu2_16830 [Galdieria sulphuraria]|eukprot:XP_005704693.1 zinc finger (C3HC4-type RING finger) family protein [Galdieria sulphuraria]